MAVFVLFHLARVGARKAGIANKHVFTPFHTVSRFLRKVLIPKFPGLPSRGHAVLALLFVGINFIILFTNMDNSALKPHSNFASRTGWMAISNMALVVFLSLKNTPLAFFSAWSYERLNILHQVAGYVAATLVVVHACTYASFFGEMHNYKKLREHEEIFGYVAGFGFLFLASSAIVIRRFWYELFYVIHVFFFIVTVIFVGLHQPEVSHRIAIVTCTIGALWATDRLWRFVRLVYYSFNNNVTVTPLPSGGTRIQLKKSPKNIPGGSHCFLWIPGIRVFEMHPFTLVGDDEHEFVVACYDGFTRHLRRWAEKNPGGKLRASVEGPYGKFPDPLLFDRVVMLAGGSGASFIVGTALNMVRHLKDGKQISFHWMVRDRSYFAWFAKFLISLNASGKVSINLHVTQHSLPSTPVDADLEKPRAEHSTPRSGSPVDAPLPEDPEKGPMSPTSPTSIAHHEHVDAHEPEHTAPRCSGVDCPAHEICTTRGIRILEGRPSVSDIIAEEVARTAKNERVLVIGCGPAGLMKDVRNSAAKAITASGPGVEIHTEQFGW